MKIIGYIHQRMVLGCGSPSTNKTTIICRKCVKTHSNTARNCRKIYDFASPWIEREIVGKCAICHADVCGTENRYAVFNPYARR